LRQSQNLSGVGDGRCAVDRGGGELLIHRGNLHKTNKKKKKKENKKKKEKKKKRGVNVLESA